MTSDMGRMLVLVGLLIVVVGLVMTYADRIPFLGRLPGDVVVQRGGLTCAVPIATSIVLSILLTIVLNVLARLSNR